MKLISRIILASAIIIFLHIPAHAQVKDVDEATREVDRAIREEAEEKLIVPPEKPPEIEEEEKKEEEAEGPKFYIRKIELLGCESFPPEDFKHLTKKYENREVTFEELNILAGEIQREYLRKGVLAACFLPPQEPKDGVVILRVVEARMGKLEIQDHRIFSKKKTASYWEIKPGEVIKYHKISRSLQLMNKNPDREVRAALHAGKEPGTTDVYLSVDESFPIHFTYSLDREGSPITGRLRKGYGMKHNNFLGLDDTLMSGHMHGKDFTAFYAYHSLPVTTFGTTLLYGLSISKSFPKKDYKRYEISAHSENASLFLHQDLFKKDDYFGEVYFGMDAKDKTIIWNQGTLNRDRLRIFRVGAKFVHKFPGNVTYIKPEFSQGLDILGAREKSDLSSRAAGSTFSKFNLGLQHKIRLPFNLQGSLNFRSQYAAEKLTPQEQFSLGGLNSVRGYPSGDYLADSAVLTNAELLIPAFIIPKTIKLPFSATSLRDDITGVLFIDHGYGERRGERQGEKSKATLASMGAGVRIRLYDQVLVRLAFAMPIADDPITEYARWRFHFSIEFEDKLHHELKRIKKSAKRK